jgi:hypothetical protein
MSSPRTDNSHTHEANKLAMPKTPDQIYDEMEARLTEKKRKEFREMWMHILKQMFPTVFWMPVLIYAVGALSVTSNGEMPYHFLLQPIVVLFIAIFAKWQTDKTRALEERIKYLEKKLSGSDSDKG